MIKSEPVMRDAGWIRARIKALIDENAGWPMDPVTWNLIETYMALLKILEVRVSEIGAPK